MKLIRLLLILMIFRTGSARSQTCNVVFTPSLGSTGQVTCVASVTPALPANTFSWSFGVGYIPSYTATAAGGGTMALPSYTTSGVYPIVVSVLNYTPACSMMQTVNVVITPTCSINFTTSPAQFSTCTGASTVSVPSMCGPINYSWTPSGTGPTPNNLCPGSYTVVATSTTACCPSATAVVVVPNNTVCSVSFTPQLSSTGQVTLVGSANPVLPTNTYSWSFGAAYIPPVVGTQSAGANTAIVTYTSSGFYIVNFAIVNYTPGCSSTQTINVTVTPTCALSFTASTAYYSQCNGSASVTVPGMCGPISYTWSNLTTGSVQSNACPGTYTVYASSSNTNCCTSATGIVVIPNFTTCSVNATFSYAVNNNSVTFNSTSAGTYSFTTYVWDYGDGSPAGFGLNSVHVYTTPGTYAARLAAINNSATCSDTSVVQLITPVFCNLIANFNYTSLPGDSIIFTSTSTGTSIGANYHWKFGDGDTAAFSSNAHKYAVPGIYIVTLTVNNNLFPPCISTKTMMVYTGCALTANFTHTVGQNGSVSFNNSSTGTFSIAAYNWNFGDGFTGNGPNPTHVYTNGGTHYVKLKTVNYPGCSDSLIQAINITGVSCVANSGFSIVPTGTPQLLDAIPSYPYNVTSALWNWGDGNSTASLYASHVYTASGNYNLCLSVTVSCGQSSTSCISQPVSNGAQPKGAGSLTINIRPPALRVSLSEEKIVFQSRVFPNPSSGTLYIDNDQALPAMYIIRNMNGQSVAEFSKTESGLLMVTTDLPDGVYFLFEESGKGRNVYRILVLSN